MEKVRLRVEFEDRHILSKSQRLEKLKRSLILLKPSQETVSDFSSYLVDIFDLYHSCPNGVTLSMDGFVLPPFESTCILQDKDIISVSRKGRLLSEIVEVSDGTHFIEENKVVENQPTLTDVPLLAHEEFGKEIGGYKSEREEDEDNLSENALHVDNSPVVSKKRKASKKLQSSNVSRKGRLLSEIVEVSDGAHFIEENKAVENQPTLTDVPLLAHEEFGKEIGGYKSEHEEDEDNRSENALHVDNSPVVSKKRKASQKLQSSKKKRKIPQVIENDYHTEQKEGCELHPGKSMDKKKQVSAVKCKHKAASTPRTAEENNDIFEHSPNLKRSGQLQENGAECNNITQTPGETTKVSSRNARRKKAKRKWLQETVKAEKKEAHETQSPEKDEKEKDHEENYTVESSLQGQVQNQKSETDNAIDEIVEDDKIVPIVIRPGHIRFVPQEEDQPVQQKQLLMETFQWNGITNKKKGQKWGREKLPYRRNDYKESNKEHSEITISEKVKPPNDPIDFDKLAQFTGLLKEGDMIAYRLLELSSTWTPELSSFRVGKTSWYDPESEKVLLTPIPEHPIMFGKLDEDACYEQSDNSLYRDDGSLEIDFRSLVDVRIIKLCKSSSAKVVTTCVNNGSSSNEVDTSTVMMMPTHKYKQTIFPSQVGGGNAWDEISQALSAKKEELIRENGWNKGKGSWSYRAMRSSALGPTMAILRAGNDL